ncbi:MAG: ATP-binding protein [Acidobacteria bacterium]|nr:ATP-binding protein [Acidobacteriota bacterium]
MTRWSIRVRLTAWVTTVLGLVLVVLAASTWWTLQESLAEAIDKGLVSRVTAIGRFLDQQTGPATMQEMEDDLREYVTLDPGWNLVRITSANGIPVYKSPAFDDTGLPPMAAELAGRGRVFRDVRMKGHPLRMITARVVARQHVYTVDVAVALGELQEALDQFRWAVLVLVPCGILAAALGGYWISRRALAPVDRIASTARAITARDLGRRLDVPATGDELQRLTETLNAMLDRLEAAFRETTRFTADASHELRSPISVIRTSAEIALRRDRSVEEYREALAGILRESERTSVLVQDLLTLTRADAGVDALQRKPLDLRVLLEDMRDSLSTLCAQASLDLQLDLPDQPVPTSGDSAALGRLVRILMDNAVKYTPAPGRVSLSLKTTPDGAVVEVADTGIGIGADDLPKVFNRFYRADKARTHDSGGAGLGLSIARWIAEQHGASIAIESESGHGCRVRVQLPLTASS